MCLTGNAHPHQEYIPYRQYISSQECIFSPEMHILTGNVNSLYKVKLNVPWLKSLFLEHSFLQRGLFDIYSMKQPDLYYFETIKNDVTILVKFCMENTSHRPVFFVNFD